MPQPFGGDITLYSATQIPHILKIMSAITLGIPEHQVRVVAPAVGGGFGSKLNVYAEELLCVALARKHSVPVRWNEARTRERPRHDPRPRPDPAHRARRRRRRQAHRAARPPASATWAPTSSSSRPASRCSAPSSTPASTTCRPPTTSTCTSVFTTMTPTDAYRGAGRPEATYAIERAMDALAAKVGVDPLELRRRNFIPTDAYPYTAWSGLVYDSGDHDAAADEAARPRRLRRAARPTDATRTSTAPPSASASACRRTSRCAASPRRGCWPR